MVRVLQADVAAALTNLHPPLSLKRSDQPLAGEDRQATAHAGSGNVRRMTPVSKGRPSSRKPST